MRDVRYHKGVYTPKDGTFVIQHLINLFKAVFFAEWPPTGNLQPDLHALKQKLVKEELLEMHMS